MDNSIRSFNPFERKQLEGVIRSAEEAEKYCFPGADFHVCLLKAIDPLNTSCVDRDMLKTMVDQYPA